MKIMNIWKEAVRKKLLFDGTKGGRLGLQDLWDLDLEQLNSIYKKVAQRLTEAGTTSLLVEPTASTAQDQLRLTIIQDVFNTKKEEKASAQQRQLRQQELTTLLAVEADAQQQALRDMSSEVRQARIKELQSAV